MYEEFSMCGEISTDRSSFLREWRFKRYECLTRVVSPVILKVSAIGRQRTLDRAATERKAARVGVLELPFLHFSRLFNAEGEKEKSFFLRQKKMNFSSYTC
jgi:hypothetical protein